MSVTPEIKPCEVIAEIIKKAEEKNLSIAHLCRTAGIDRSTWERWRNEGLPKSVKAYLAIQKEIL